MGQRARILTEIWGFQGWKVKEVFYEDKDGKRLMLIPGYAPGATGQLVIRVERGWAPRCSQCGAICHKEGRGVSVTVSPSDVEAARCNTSHDRGPRGRTH